MLSKLIEVLKFILRYEKFVISIYNIITFPNIMATLVVYVYYLCRKYISDAPHANFSQKANFKRAQLKNTTYKIGLWNSLDQTNC